MKKLVFLSLFLGLSISSFAQKKLIERIEPMHWWADMHNPELQIMIYGKDVSLYTATTSYEGFTIRKQIKGDSPNYLFVYAELDANIKPGEVDFILKNGKKSEKFQYELKARIGSEGRHQGFNASDLIYLMMPDRFANGNPKNDNVDGMLEKVDRSKPGARHGGDIKGVTNHLDYIKDLGMTAIWFTPIFENDMTPEYGAYHGYAATDMYKIDRRYGTNDEFRDFISLCHKNDMKVIMDMIHNHIGDQHWWMKDLPTNDWVNDVSKYGMTNYRGEVVSDPYQSEFDYNRLTKGWFVKEMPDLNQENELLADYLIQNTLWWIEEFGIDGIRMDTYVYPNRHYMARWAKEVLEAYPTFDIVGEAWVNTVAHEAYWQKDFKSSLDNYNSFLPSVTDFQIEYALVGAFTEPFGWKSGIMNVYQTLAQDNLYSDPMKNVIFLDNHDLVRYIDQIGKDKAFYKMGYAMLITLRGIPQVYYGTELMFGETGVGGDASKRPDMPGGWNGDSRSVFNAEGRTEVENEIFDYVKTLNNWRKGRKSIHEGKMKHFIPEENVYVYFRYTDSEATMVIANLNDKEVTIAPKRFNEILRHYSKGKVIIENREVDVTKPFSVKGKTTSLIELY